MEETECRLQRVNIYISLDYVICNDNMYYRALKNGPKKKKRQTKPWANIKI